MISNPLTCGCELQSTAFWALVSKTTLSGSCSLPGNEGKLPLTYLTGICLNCGKFIFIILLVIKYYSCHGSYQIIAFSKEIAVIIFLYDFCLAYFIHDVHFYGTY